ncbi:MAG: lytic transglycosylase domain-containing protein [Phycisphaerales bacterium]|nr:lytic transglycosylase domain-containing protein [Phycisphaerales bacterium]
MSKRSKFIWYGFDLRNPVTVTKLLFVSISIIIISIILINYKNIDYEMVYLDNNAYAQHDDKRSSKNIEAKVMYNINSSFLSKVSNKNFKQYIDVYIQREGLSLYRIKYWGKEYFVVYDAIFKKYNLPTTLKYVSVIESNLNPHLHSRVGAVGLWQLMPYDAKAYNLKLYPNDEREDIYKSTNCIAQIFTKLYKHWGNWLLVLAAYNGGEHRLSKAIARAHSRDYWDVDKYLPYETRYYVRKFIITTCYFDGVNNNATVLLSSKQLEKRTKILTYNNDLKTCPWYTFKLPYPKINNCNVTQKKNDNDSLYWSYFFIAPAPSVNRFGTNKKLVSIDSLNSTNLNRVQKNDLVLNMAL